MCLPITRFVAFSYCKKPKIVTNKGLKHHGTYCLMSEKTNWNSVSPRVHTLSLHLVLPPQRVGFCPDLSSCVQGGCHSSRPRIVSQPDSKARYNERRLRARALSLYGEGGDIPETPWKMTSFRPHCSKIWHLGILDPLN